MRLHDQASFSRPAATECPAYWLPAYWLLRTMATCVICASL